MSSDAPRDSAEPETTEAVPDTEASCTTSTLREALKSASIKAQNAIPDAMDDIFEESLRAASARGANLMEEQQRRWDEAQECIADAKTRPWLWGKATLEGLETKVTLAKEAMQENERQFRTKVWSEYVTTMKKVEPDLRRSGGMVSTAAIAMCMPGVSGNKPSGRPVDTKEERGIWHRMTGVTREDPLKPLEPLIAPILDPFVAGLIEPLEGMLNQYTHRVLLALIGTSLVSFGTGWLAAKLLGRRRRPDD